MFIIIHLRTLFLFLIPLTPCLVLAWSFIIPLTPCLELAWSFIIYIVYPCLFVSQLNTRLFWINSSPTWFSSHLQFLFYTKPLPQGYNLPFPQVSIDAIFEVTLSLWRRYSRMDKRGSTSEIRRQVMMLTQVQVLRRSRNAGPYKSKETFRLF